MDERQTAAKVLYASITVNDYDNHVVEPYQSFYKDLVDKLKISNFVYYVTCQVIKDERGDLVLLYDLFTENRLKHANQDTALPMMLMYLFTIGIISAGDAIHKDIQTDELRKSMHHMISNATRVHVNIRRVDENRVVEEAIQENVVLPYVSKTVDEAAINGFKAKNNETNIIGVFEKAYNDAKISGNLTGIDMTVTTDVNDVNVFFTLKTGSFVVPNRDIPRNYIRW